jgi:predicted heme/steroid binding protein/uncharacterized membrane protein
MEKEFDKDELAVNDGKDGRPIYICHGNRVIDVSTSPLWAGGLHMGRHGAGKDLTVDIESAPHGLEVLERYPQAGRFNEKPGRTDAHLPESLSLFLARHPFFRRHPHPATVHFPIVLSACVTAFSILYALTGDHSFDKTSFYCLIGSLFFTPVAVVTGLLTWWINYMARRMRPTSIKQIMSLFMLIVLAVLFVWRIVSPDPMEVLVGRGLIYFALVLTLGPTAIVTSYYGGTLTFPLEKASREAPPSRTPHGPDKK